MNTRSPAFVVGVSAAGRASLGTAASAAEHVDTGTWQWYSARERPAERAVALCAWFNRRAAARERVRVCHAYGRVLS